MDRKKTWLRKKTKKPLIGKKTWIQNKKKKKLAKHFDLIRGKMSETQDWSKLCQDILRPVLESLSSLDFDRAKKVCSDWYSVSKTCVRNLLCPWSITYQGDSSMLFDPEKKEGRYQTNLLHPSSKTYCMASSGDWFLLVDSYLRFSIVNLLTRKEINLPSIDSSIRYDDGEDIVRCKSLAVLWMNEKTEDYVVAWIFKQHYLLSLKKGDDSWRDWNSTKRDNDDWWDDPDPNLDGANMCYYDMAYKNGKLYLYTLDHYIKIRGVVRYYPRDGLTYPFNFVEQPWEYIWKRRIAIRDSGEVLIVMSLKEVVHDEEKLLFYVFKINFKSKKWERVYSIGDDEMLIFGHGVTMKAPVQDIGDGIKSNTICFVEDDIWPNSNRPSNCGIFDLATSRITWTKRFGAYIDQTRWFIPRFA